MRKVMYSFCLLLILCLSTNSVLLANESTEENTGSKSEEEQTREKEIAESKANKKEGIEISEGNFPDATFKDYYVRSFDVNSDGYLQNEELGIVKDLIIDQNKPEYSKSGHKPISSLRGIEFFVALESLKLNGTGFGDIDLSNNNNLKKLAINNTKKTININLGNNTSIEAISITYPSDQVMLNSEDLDMSLINTVNTKTYYAGSYDDSVNLTLNNQNYHLFSIKTTINNKSTHFLSADTTKLTNANQKAVAIDYEYATKEENIKNDEIIYVDDNGESINKGTTSDQVEPPRRAGYTFNGWESIYSVSNESFIARPTWTVESPVNTIIIEQVDENGNLIEKPIIENIISGSQYEIPVQLINGYTTNQNLIKGIANQQVKVVRVVFTKNKKLKLVHFTKQFNGTINVGQNSVVNTKDSTNAQLNFMIMFTMAVTIVMLLKFKKVRL